MKVVFLNRKNIKYSLVGIILLVLAIICLLCFSGRSIGTVVEPIYQGDEEINGVALAINVDWGEEVLPQMLKVLEEKDVKATFFVTGRFAQKFPELIKAIDDQGHSIGNHGFAHPHPDQISQEANYKDIVDSEKVIMEITGKKPTLFAPAYGEHGDNCLLAAEQAGYQAILWSADTVDWQVPPPSVETLVARVTGEKLHNGSIILMHPKAHTIEALPTIIDTIREKGYTIELISDLL